MRDKINVEEARQLWDTIKECQICRSTLNLNMDHDHQTGKIRGILCNPCNQALGQFKDRKDLLTEAIKYLEKAA